MLLPVWNMICDQILMDQDQNNFKILPESIKSIMICLNGYSSTRLNYYISCHAVKRGCLTKIVEYIGTFEYNFNDFKDGLKMEPTKKVIFQMGHTEKRHTQRTYIWLNQKTERKREWLLMYAYFGTWIFFFGWASLK